MHSWTNETVPTKLHSPDGNIYTKSYTQNLYALPYVCAFAFWCVFVYGSVYLEAYARHINAFVVMVMQFKHYYYTLRESSRDAVIIFCLACVARAQCPFARHV